MRNWEKNLYAPFSRLMRFLLFPSYEKKIYIYTFFHLFAHNVHKKLIHTCGCRRKIPLLRIMCNYHLRESLSRYFSFFFFFHFCFLTHWCFPAINLQTMISRSKISPIFPGYAIFLSTPPLPPAIHLLYYLCKTFFEATLMHMAVKTYRYAIPIGGSPSSYT